MKAWVGVLGGGVSGKACAKRVWASDRQVLWEGEGGEEEQFGRGRVMGRWVVWAVWVVVVVGCFGVLSLVLRVGTRQGVRGWWQTQIGERSACRRAMWTRKCR